ncbi:hypothetical protein QBC41DRAFT_56587 [Cercophora samala]|uniref:Uncharacterized protein n=1 Tax=Cercophora samala TaxID=330535 RepID=A0AA40DCH2_9PEZI|nr:hypothetical protein QBC41DRAFT_56587 [Cercophora samala]
MTNKIRVSLGIYLLGSFPCFDGTNARPPLLRPLSLFVTYIFVPAITYFSLVKRAELGGITKFGPNLITRFLSRMVLTVCLSLASPPCFCLLVVSMFPFHVQSLSFDYFPVQGTAEIRACLQVVVGWVARRVSLRRQLSHPHHSPMRGLWCRDGEWGAMVKAGIKEGDRTRRHPNRCWRDIGSRGLRRVFGDAERHLSAGEPIGTWGAEWCAVNHVLVPIEVVTASISRCIVAP